MREMFGLLNNAQGSLIDGVGNQAAWRAEVR